MTFNPYSNQLHFRLVDFERIPEGVHGVYGIWYMRRCIYIGKAKVQTISQRLEQHWRGTHNTKLQKWIEAKSSHLRITFQIIQNKNKIDDFERYCIHRFQPLTNSVRYRSSVWNDEFNVKRKN